MSVNHLDIFQWSVYIEITRGNCYRMCNTRQSSKALCIKGISPLTPKKNLYIVATYGQQEPVSSQRQNTFKTQN